MSLNVLTAKELEQLNRIKADLEAFQNTGRLEFLSNAEAYCGYLFREVYERTHPFLE